MGERHSNRIAGPRIPDMICKECAEELGGEFAEPEARFYGEFCPRCEEFRNVADKKSWVWPI
jgi:hypothetical protein